MTMADVSIRQRHYSDIDDDMDRVRKFKQRAKKHNHKLKGNQKCGKRAGKTLDT